MSKKSKAALIIISAVVILGVVFCVSIPVVNDLHAKKARRYPHSREDVRGGKALGKRKRYSVYGRDTDRERADAGGA